MAQSGGGKGKSKGKGKQDDGKASGADASQDADSNDFTSEEGLEGILKLLTAVLKNVFR